MVKKVVGLREISDKYNAFFFDLDGVLVKKLSFSGKEKK